SELLSRLRNGLAAIQRAVPPDATQALEPFTLDVGGDDILRVSLPSREASATIGFKNGPNRHDKVFANSSVGRFLIAVAQGSSVSSFSKNDWKRAHRAIASTCGADLSLDGSLTSPRFSRRVSLSPRLKSRIPR